MGKLYKVFILSEDGNNLEYKTEAPNYHKAIEIALDKAFEEHPDGRFMLGGYEVLGPNYIVKRTKQGGQSDV